MKALFVDQFSLNEGKDVFYLAKKINKLQDSINVELYFRSDDGREKYSQDESTIVYFNFGDAYHGNFIKKIITYVKSISTLKKFIIKNKYDVVVLQWFSIPWIENSFVKSIRKRCKVITIVHDIIPFNKKVGMIRALKKIYNNSNLIFVHSELAKKEFMNIYSKTIPIHVVSNAFCDKNLYHIVPLVQARKKMGISLDKFVVLYYGSIRESKGLDVLMEAFLKANKIEPSIYLLAGGAFQGISKERKNYYLDLANKINSSRIGKIQIGFVDDEAEPFFFSSSNLLCLPYKNGWQSGVAQLGLCYELPILSSDIEEMKDVVVNDYNGMFFKNSNIDDLCEKLVFLCRNQNKLKEYSANSVSLYYEKFTIDKKATDFIQGINMVLNSQNNENN